MRADRFIEIAQGPARLSLRTGLIAVARENEPEVTVPVGELACVILADPQASITQPAMAALMAAGCPIIVLSPRSRRSSTRGSESFYSARASACSSSAFMHATAPAKRAARGSRAAFAAPYPPKARYGCCW